MAKSVSPSRVDSPLSPKGPTPRSISSTGSLSASSILAMRRFSTIISMFVAAAATFAILAYKNATALKLRVHQLLYSVRGIVNRCHLHDAAALTPSTRALRKNLSADDLASFAEVVFQVLPGHAPRKVVHVQPVRRDLDHLSVEIRLILKFTFPAPSSSAIGATVTGIVSPTTIATDGTSAVSITHNDNLPW